MKLQYAIWLTMLICGIVPAQQPATFSLSEDAPVETAETAAANEPPSPRRTQWLMFTAGWCQPCASAKQDFQDWLRDSEWIVDDTESAHIRLIDGDKHSTLMDRYQITQYPTFLLMRDGEVLYRQSGYPGREALVKRFQQAVASAPVVGAVSVGTLKGQRDNVAQLISALKPMLSGGGTLTLRLDRTQSQTATLPLGESLAIRIDDPVVMNFSLRNEQLICRFEEPLPRARMSFGVPLEQSISAVTISVSEIVLELPRAPDVKLRVEP